MNKKDKIEYISEEDALGVDKKLKKLRGKLKESQKKAEEYLTGWQRTKADLINYRKEQEQKISDYYKFANEGLILEILLVLDNFNIALNHLPKESKKDKWLEGILQIKKQLEDSLTKQGVEEIKTLGEKFNPEFHESIGAVKSNKKGGTIIEEVQRGYKLNGKVIRPSRVKISN